MNQQGFLFLYSGHAPVWMSVFPKASCQRALLYFISAIFTSVFEIAVTEIESMQIKRQAGWSSPGSFFIGSSTLAICWLRGKIEGENRNLHFQNIRGFFCCISNIAASQLLKNRWTLWKRIREEKLLHVSFLLVCCYFTFLPTVTPAQRYSEGLGDFSKARKGPDTSPTLFISKGRNNRWDIHPFRFIIPK